MANNQKAGTIKKPRPQILATASQAVNRRDAKAEIGGLDIKLENIDVSFGTKYVFFCLIRLRG